MWKTGITTLVKIEKKEEWDRLDVVSKWLISTRSAVTVATIYSGVIGGMLAFRDGHFSLLPWLIVTLGLFLAHGANNLLNDYTDFRRGVDLPPYFRTKYSVHPLAQKFWTARQQLLWFAVSGALAVAAGNLLLLLDLAFVRGSRGVLGLRGKSVSELTVQKIFFSAESIFSAKSAYMIFRITQ
jgi:1,4-dihydroxy-2-naphthoate octaprenyltransferase